MFATRTTAVSKKSYTRKAMSIAALFLAAVSVTGCESENDIARKPALSNALIQNALKNCDLQGDESALYSIRLREVFMNSYARSLDYLRKNDITVCLDKRLIKQDDKHWYESTIRGFFYNQAQHLVVTLYDTGKTSDETGIFDESIVPFASDALDRMEDNFTDYDFKIAGNPPFLSGYRISCGKGCMTSKWYDDNAIHDARWHKVGDMTKPPLAKGLRP